VPLRNLRNTTLQSFRKPLQDSSIKGTSAVGIDKENIAPTSNMLTMPSRKLVSSAPVRCDWDDLDAEDAEDPLMVSEYVVEIFEYMKNLEV